MLRSEGVGRDEGIETLTESLKSLADHAAKRGVTVCVETHDDWCNPEHLAEVMRRVQQPAIAVNWDIMHPVRAGHATMGEAFEALRPWIQHLHVHDGTMGEFKLTPVGEGAIDHREAIELLLRSGYDGYLSGEWIGWEPWEVHLPRELATLRRYEQEVG